MRNQAWLFIVLAALALIVWWRWSPEQARPPEREAPTATRAEPGEPPATPVQERSGAAAGQERTDLDRPGLAPERLDLDRRPWDPKKELRVRYEIRAKAVDAIDRFAAETGLSDQRFQKLLLILYDYQENQKLIHAQIEPLLGLISKQEFEQWLDDSEVLRTSIRDDTRARARELLTPDEYRTWERMMARDLLWSTLSVDRIIVPAEGDDRPSRR